jgi:dedicated sortase system histidine kinase
LKLRYQLFLIGLLLLILPWSAWQYLKAFDSALRQSQSESLVDQAKLVAGRLAIQPELFSQPFVSDNGSSVILYAYPLSSAPIVDGYDDDGRDYKTLFNTNKNHSDDSLVNIKAAIYRQQFYFFIDIRDEEIHYFNPLAEKNRLADRLEFQFLDQTGQKRTYLLQTSAPGNIIASYEGDDGRLRQQANIKGVWREHAKGYQLELSINISLLENGFQLKVVDYDGSEQSNHAENVNNSEKNNFRFIFDEEIQVLTVSPDLEILLRSLDTSFTRLSILNPQQWVIASIAGQNNSISESRSPWFIEWLYRRVLESKGLPIRKAGGLPAYIDYPEVPQALVENGALYWYRSGGRYFDSQTLASVAMPIRDKNELLGYVLLEKTTDQLVESTTTAFNRLFIYIGGTFFIVIIILLVYASWLSWRISRLNRAANNVIDDSGVITLDKASWPELNNIDELGDLSRGYRKLLLRLQEYNDYLKTLSSKLSHELRTPIAVVKSSLENLSQVEEENLKKQYCQRAQEGINRLNSILNAMSTASRIEQSVTNAEFEKVDLNQFFVLLVDTYNDTYRASELKFTSEVSNGHAFIAQELFVQMVDKLVDNAVDFSPKGEAIDIKLTSDKNFLSIHIENAGPLLPESMKGQLFESMVSLRPSSDSKNKTHLGLGLYIARLIAELHKGHIVANNRDDGSGVVFSIVLPEQQ